MLCKRLVTLLTLNEGVLYRTKEFSPDYRYTLNFVDSWLVDEIIILNISRNGRSSLSQFLDVAGSIADKSFVPICFGGGLRNLDDIKTALNYGADKISLNTALHDNPSFVKDAVLRYGSQCIVASIDVKLIDNSYFVYTDVGRSITKFTAFEFALYCENLGCGEILLNCVNKDGSLPGYDNVLLSEVSSRVSIPIIAAGGAGKWQDSVDGINIGGADAVATSNVFHFTESSIRSAKLFMSKRGIPVRL